MASADREELTKETDQKEGRVTVRKVAAELGIKIYRVVAAGHLGDPFTVRSLAFVTFLKICFPI